MQWRDGNEWVQISKLILAEEDWSERKSDDDEGISRDAVAKAVSFNDVVRA